MANRLSTAWRRYPPVDVQLRDSLLPKSDVITKGEWRTRAASFPTPSVSENRAVVEHLHRYLATRLPQILVGYHALGDEVDLEPLRQRLPGWRWLLTRVSSDDSSLLTLHDWGGPMERHRLGMTQPVEDTPEVDPIHVEVILAPGLLFTADGRRLGRGGGHYDRLLARLPLGVERIGVTTEARVVPELPAEEHDIPMTAIVTESGVQGV